MTHVRRVAARRFWDGSGVFRIFTIAGSVAALLFVADLIYVVSGASARPDRLLDLDFHHWLPASLHRAMLGFSLIGSSPVVFAVSAVAALLLARLRRFQASVVMLLGPIGASTLDTAFKGLTHRSRPHLWPHAMVIHSFSFPSGHSTAAAALGASACYVVARERRSALVPVAILACAFALCVGVSRLYLGVHWPTDVAGGYLLAIAWVFLSGQVVYTAFRP